MLAQLFEALRAAYPGLGGRAFTDTAPLAEKQLAAEAGLGWIGRQSLLVTPQFGTRVLLGELILTDEADAYDTPFGEERCGTCRRCVEACPTGAIAPDRTIDTARCISCRTIEKVPESDAGLDGWIFGCDCCQSCCPWNLRAPRHRNAAFDPVFDPLAMDAAAWLGMDETAFEVLCGRTPLTGPAEPDPVPPAPSNVTRPGTARPSPLQHDKPSPTRHAPASSNAAQHNPTRSRHRSTHPSPPTPAQHTRPRRARKKRVPEIRNPPYDSRSSANYFDNSASAALALSAAGPAVTFWKAAMACGFISLAL